MTTVTANGNVYSDDGSETRDMTNGGHRDYLLPMMSDVMTEISTLRGYGGSSTTSLAIGTGTKTFTVTPGTSTFAVGMMVKAVSAANEANYMVGSVTSWSGGTLVVSVTLTGGSGTLADWVIGGYVSSADLSTLLAQGLHTIWIPATAMVARTTNGAASGSSETSTNKIMLKSLDFDASTIEYAQFQIRMPKSWNEGTVTAAFTWTHGSTTTNFKVSWGLQGVALSDDDAADTAFGTAQYANDTGGTTNDIYVSPTTSAITIAGTPAAEDWVVFQVLRKADDGTNDTLAVDAKLLGVTLYYTIAAATDA